jgi:hypothetical protein
MTRPTSLTLAALVAAVIGAGFAAPVLAQDQGPGPGPRDHQQMRGPNQHDGGFVGREFGRGGPGGLLALVCSKDGADRTEHMLLTIAQRTDLTDQQQPLYDAFKSAALDAQADFATACADARPVAQDASAKPDLAARLKTRLDIEKAHVAAMTSVLPAFESFYNSLSDEQKAAIEPRHRLKARMLDEPGRRHGPGMEQERPGDVEPPTQG